MIHICGAKSDKAGLKMPVYTEWYSFLLIKQMAKKTRKSRKSRRRTRRRVPKKGGANSYPIIPADAAINVSTAGENTDNTMGMK
jgi:hypothetical protein